MTTRRQHASDKVTCDEVVRTEVFEGRIYTYIWMIPRTHRVTAVTSKLFAFSTSFFKHIKFAFFKSLYHYSTIFPDFTYACTYVLLFDFQCFYSNGVDRPFRLFRPRAERNMSPGTYYLDTYCGEQYENFTWAFDIYIYEYLHLHTTSIKL